MTGHTPTTGEAPMHPYPHHYTVRATAEPTGEVTLAGQNLPTLATAPPVEFDGPGDRWSPETLLCGAVADCYILSFRAIARASRIEWNSLDCRVEGRLDRIEGRAQFTQFVLHVTLRVPSGTDQDRSLKLLEKAEHLRLVSNSLSAEKRLDPTVIVG
jgi:organic hydroperoxide reductase OsmC/OhrA